MVKRLWYKAAALAISGTVLGLGAGLDGCLGAAIQRILISVAFD